jgi:RNA polymerase sigma-70 factor, ECF subfamily
MSRDTENFNTFYRGTNRRLLHQMYAMTGNIDDAMDCVQEAYARAWQHWRTVRHVADPDAWIRTVAWRIAANRRRKMRNGARAFARSGIPEHAQPPSIDHIALVSALREISDEQRRAIVLHYLVGMSVLEIAEEVGAPTGTVKARLARGRTALAGLLRDELGTEHPADAELVRQLS